jgi:signal transduction histidine kinase
MIALGRLWRTSTFRLMALFILIFVIASVSLIGFMSYQASIQIQKNQSREIEQEMKELIQLERKRGIRAVANTMQILARRAGAGIYYLGDDEGRMLVGNVSNFPSNVLAQNGVHTFDYSLEEAFPNNAREKKRRTGYALVSSKKIRGGFRLIVGRDIVERRGYSAIIFKGFGLAVIGIVILSLFAGALMAMRVLKRLDAISDTTDKIVSGNMSERIPITKRDDEFDRLAISLNDMLDRIENLMIGLKEVTDNVAHDLKTPLTRMRNKAEAALRNGVSAKSRKEALQATIDESDQLIRTFNALLMISRVEAGAPSGSFTDFDISELVNDMGELYAPVAEDADIEFIIEAPKKIKISANRELIGQAIVNLIENAIKYAKKHTGSAKAKNKKIMLSVKELNEQVIIEISDNGIGISKEDRKRALERFVRLEKSRTEAGSGLGLSLVNAVAKLHKGKFSLQDNKPGVRAIIEIPKSD